MANWIQNRDEFRLVHKNVLVGAVRQDKVTDRSSVGWRAYVLGPPPESRHIEDAGYFRTLKAAMQHVMVLHKLEN